MLYVKCPKYVETSGEILLIELIQSPPDKMFVISKLNHFHTETKQLLSQA